MVMPVKDRRSGAFFAMDRESVTRMRCARPYFVGLTLLCRTVVGLSLPNFTV